MSQAFMGNTLRDVICVAFAFHVVDQTAGLDMFDALTGKIIVALFVILLGYKFIKHLADPDGDTLALGAHRKKKSEAGRDEWLEWASSEMQGWRPAMEDATCIVPALPEDLGRQALFAVFDGHGGREVSRIASTLFPKVLANCAAKEVPTNGSEVEDESSPEASKAGSPTNGVSERGSRDLGQILHRTMLDMDMYIRQGGDGRGSRSPPELAGIVQPSAPRNAYSLMGSTAVVALVEHGDAGAGRGRPRRIVVANCGDSRAMVCRGGKAVELSEDHKPENPEERARICKAGGHVAQIGPCHRIDGWGLNLSRALGDFHYKANTDLEHHQQKVIAVPEIRTLDLTEDDEFLLLGCDGIFELNTSQKAVDIVRAALLKGLSVEKAAEMLLDKSCSPNLMITRGKGGDNCSAIVVRLRK